MHILETGANNQLKKMNFELYNAHFPLHTHIFHVFFVWSIGSQFMLLDFTFENMNALI